jgi:hypothetical protein
MRNQDIYIKINEDKLNPVNYKLFDNSIIVMKIADYIDICNTNISDIIISIKESLQIIKNKSFFRIICIDNLNCSMKIIFKDKSFKIVGVYIEDDHTKVNLGVKSYLDNRTKKFWEDYSIISKYVDSMYFEADKTCNLEYFLKIIDSCLSLGVKYVFFIYSNKNNIFDEDYFLRLSIIVDFLNITLNKNQKIFVVIGDHLVDIAKSGIYTDNAKDATASLGDDKKEEIEDDTVSSETLIKSINNIFKNTNIVPVLSMIFSPIDCLRLDSSEIFLDKMNILRDKGFITGSYINNVSDNLFKYLAFDVSCISSTLDNDIWLNYIFFIDTVSKITSTEIVLYNIPAGHSNNTLEISPYTKTIYHKHSNTPGDYSGTAPLFFFGGKEREERKVIIFPEHLSLCFDHNIKHILFGAKDTLGVSCVPWKYTIYRMNDKYYIISKIQEYTRAR